MAFHFQNSTQRRKQYLAFHCISRPPSKKITIFYVKFNKASMQTGNMFLDQVGKGLPYMSTESDLDIFLSLNPEKCNEKVKISQINIYGCVRTKTLIVERAFSNVYVARNMKELNNAIKHGIHAFSSIQAHDKVFVQLDISNENEASPVLNLIVKECLMKPSVSTGIDLVCRYFTYTCIQILVSI